MNSAHPRSSEIAGKTFLIGEYAVLAGNSALVAAVGPRFRAQVDEAAPEFVPESPAGRLQSFALAAGLSPVRLRFEDPHGGSGGFGASTAQFALLYLEYAKQAGWSTRTTDVWRLYRELTAQAEVPPSGADLVAQWQGGVVLWEPREPRATEVWPLINWQSVLVFSASGIPGRKTPTHQHLGSLRALPDVSSLVPHLNKALNAVRDGRFDEFGDCVSAYASALAELGLEHPDARADREALGRMPGVLGVKGTGALLSDGVIVVMDPSSAHRDTLIERAESRGLKLISAGLTKEWGIACP